MYTVKNKSEAFDRQLALMNFSIEAGILLRGNGEAFDMFKRLSADTAIIRSKNPLCCVLKKIEVCFRFMPQLGRLEGG